MKLLFFRRAMNRLTKWHGPSATPLSEPSRKRNLPDKLQILLLEAPDAAKQIEKIVDGALEELGLDREE